MKVGSCGPIFIERGAATRHEKLLRDKIRLSEGLDFAGPDQARVAASCFARLKNQTVACITSCEQELNSLVACGFPGSLGQRFICPQSPAITNLGSKRSDRC
jgi:hypothetical protein